MHVLTVGVVQARSCSLVKLDRLRFSRVVNRGAASPDSTKYYCRAGRRCEEVIWSERSCCGGRATRFGCCPGESVLIVRTSCVHVLCTVR